MNKPHEKFDQNNLFILYVNQKLRHIEEFTTRSDCDGTESDAVICADHFSQ